MAPSLGEDGRCSGLRVGSSERPRPRVWARAEQRPVVGDVEPEGDGAGRDSRRAEEMTQGAVRRVDARAALTGVGLDVRRRVRARGVEASVGPRGGSRQQELQDRSEEPRGSSGGRTPAHREHCYIQLNLEFPPAR